MQYDAILFVSFGGPEKMDDVIPFLENVLRGKNVPRERLLEVAEHYRHFGGVSPINQQCRELITALRAELDRSGIPLPIYWGNRNWHPLLTDTLRQMKEDGIKRALAYITSAYSSYSGCRQYCENIAAAQQAVGPARRRSTSCECSTITPTSLPLMSNESRLCWIRFPPTDVPPPSLPSPLTAFPYRCRTTATTSSS